MHMYKPADQKVVQDKSISQLKINRCNIDIECVSLSCDLTFKQAKQSGDGDGHTGQHANSPSQRTHTKAHMDISQLLRLLSPTTKTGNIPR